MLRPHVEVATTGLEELEQEVAGFDPQVVVSSRPQKAIQSPTITWVKAPTDDLTQPTEVWFGERRWEMRKPTLEMLVAIIDGTEEKLAQKKDAKKRQQPWGLLTR